MHDYLSHLVLWQTLAQRHTARQYRGGVARRAPVIGRLIGRGLQLLGHGLTALGNRLQGDVIAAPPCYPQPVER